tara:strand:+ start:117 stop:806 length:690 start_codon:yes stop_codon:yes gene_type:complete
MSYYFSILFISILVPFVFSFHSRIKFYKHFKVLSFSIPLVSVPYIYFDKIFTDLSIWGFNSEHISRFYFYSLPLEEILFFLIIPFCCLYTYQVIEKNDFLLFNNISFYRFNILFSIILIIIGFIYLPRIYTFYCLLSCAFLILIENYYFKIIDYRIFYTTFLLILIPFLIVNGALTGMFLEKMVVWYNPLHIIGIRIFTIPIEDTVYAYQLILANLLLWKYLETKKHYI